MTGSKSTTSLPHLPSETGKIQYGFEPSQHVGSIVDQVKHLRSMKKPSGFHRACVSEHGSTVPHITTYLHTIEPHISTDLISLDNYSEIKKLAGIFTGDLTSFFGFETRLHSDLNRSDYLFAVSSKNGERERLHHLLHSGTIPDHYFSHPAWQRIRSLVDLWADPQSALHHNIKGLWFEFDTAQTDQEIPLPGIFIHTAPIRIDSPEEKTKYSWLIDTALPTLAGDILPPSITQHLYTAFEQLPSNAVVFQVALMLSRGETGVRIVVMRLDPADIVSYLQTIGWTGNAKKLQALIDESSSYTSRINVQIQISEHGIEPKIGLECNFLHDQFHVETKWTAFLDYLITNNLCLPEKKALLLDFAGVDQEDPAYDFSFTSYQVAAKIHETTYSKALVRYLNHIKINFHADSSVEAKAYPGVRLFGKPCDVSYQ